MRSININFLLKLQYDYKNYPYFIGQEPVPVKQ